MLPHGPKQITAVSQGQPMLIIRHMFTSSFSVNGWRQCRGSIIIDAAVAVSQQPAEPLPHGLPACFPNTYATPAHPVGSTLHRISAM